ncbi:MAG: phospholipase D-like domain-containing protein, partial [Gemmataceae bacterium]
MRFTIPGVTGELVLTKDESGYQEVVEAFPTASWVEVVTFNISQKQDKLLSALRGLEAPLRLIADIPGRLDKYWGSSQKAKYIKEKAAADIQLYMEKLAPEEFGPLASISFCFSNHAKIIITDTVGYVGSANYSEESARNWEAGIIVRDPESLKLVSRFVDEIERDSIRYYGKSMIESIVPLVAARQRLMELKGQLAEDFQLVDRQEVTNAVEQLGDAIGESDRAWSEAFEESGPVYSRIDTVELRRIEEWFEGDETIWEYDDATRKLEAAERGEIDAGELPVNNDGIIPDSAFEEVVEDLQLEREKSIIAAQKATSDLQQRIAEVCKQVDD